MFGHPSPANRDLLFLPCCTAPAAAPGRVKHTRWHSNPRLFSECLLKSSADPQDTHRAPRCRPKKQRLTRGHTGLLPFGPGDANSLEICAVLRPQEVGVPGAQHRVAATKHSTPLLLGAQHCLVLGCGCGAVSDPAVLCGPSIPQHAVGARAVRPRRHHQSAAASEAHGDTRHLELIPGRRHCPCVARGGVPLCAIGLRATSGCCRHVRVCWPFCVSVCPFVPSMSCATNVTDCQN